MAQIKAQDVNWLDEAWRISAVIAGLPSAPPGLLSVESRWPPLTGSAKLVIELLQDKIAMHLAYRSKTVHKTAYRFPDGAIALVAPQSRNPAATARLMYALVQDGVKLQPVDHWAYDAHMKLGRILIDRYVCKEWRRLLPLIVASIGGESTSQTAKLKATQPRPRPPVELKVHKLNALEKYPNYTWKQLLQHLQALGIVISWNDTDVHWLSANDDEKSTLTTTFQKWKAD